MTEIPEFLTRIEQKLLWAYIHKDWLLQIRELLRPQLARELAIFVESESVLVSPRDEAPLAVFVPDIGVARSNVIDPALNHPNQASATILEVDEEIEPGLSTPVDLTLSCSNVLPRDQRSHPVLLEVSFHHLVTSWKTSCAAIDSANY